MFDSHRFHARHDAPFLSAFIAVAPRYVPLLSNRSDLKDCHCSSAHGQGSTKDDKRAFPRREIYQPSNILHLVAETTTLPGAAFFQHMPHLTDTATTGPVVLRLTAATVHNRSTGPLSCHW